MPHVLGVNDDEAGFGVKGENTTPASLGNFHEAGVVGTSQGGVGVFGTSGDISSFHPFGSADIGVQGVSPHGTGVSAISGTGHGVSGVSDSGDGVLGVGRIGIHGRSSSPTDGGVLGENTGNGAGVLGTSAGGAGVAGQSDTGTGVSGESQKLNGVLGISHSPTGAAISASNDSGGPGLFAESTKGGIGVSGNSVSFVGVKGESQTHNGVLGISHSSTVAAVSASNKSGGIGLFSEGAIAGQFHGEVQIEGGNLTMLNGTDVRLADFAEDFDISGEEEIDPGTVVVLDHDGSVQKSRSAYDNKVAGVISGAGNFKSAITLDRQKSQGNRISIALMGKVYCKVDAQYAPVEVGDLLATSPTPGHAMKAADPLKAFGSVIGKALRSIKSGQGLIPVLVALQ